MMALEVQTPQHQHQYHVDGTRGTASGSSLATLHQIIPVNLDLFHSFSLLPHHYIELEEPCLLPFGWQKFLHHKTGEVCCTKIKEKMSRKNGNSPKLDLKLNLSPPRVGPRGESPNRSATVSPTSPPSSCLSSEMNQEDTSLPCKNSPEATSMVLVGCPRCLMYVMLSEDDPKCPKCKSTVLLDFLNDNTAAKTGKS